MYSSAERLSIVLSIWSVAIIILGFKMFYRLLPIFLFLLLMLPPPRIIHTSLMLPLQNMATVCSAFCLQTMGYAVIRQGNILLINNSAVAVSEACNGLRMITAFFIIVVFISLIIKKNTWEKILLLLSGLPIAFVCNIIRLTFTAVIFTIVSGRKWTTLFHDFGGFAMVPLAVALVVLELWLMNSLVTWPQKNKTQIVMTKFNN
jgi:exosortase